MSIKSNEIKPIAYFCNGKIITFSQPLIMAIVNLTPDSFYDGGKFDSVNDVIRDVEEKICLGADIIDIGAASSRPNAAEISEVEEWNRLRGVLEALRKHFPDIIISVDTYRSTVATKSADLGANIINDISGGNLDAKMFETVAHLDLPYVLMHMTGTPQTMQQNPPMQNAADEVKDEFVKKIKKLLGLGFSKIILDPGFGFGKSVENNYQLLKSLQNYSDLGFPVLAGVSRKSMINKVIGTNPVTALNGTTVLNTIALLNGATILRVHDVTEARQAIRLVSFYKNA